MSRRNAREIALHILYEMTYDANPFEEIMEEHLSPEGREKLSREISVYTKNLDEADEAFVRMLTQGVRENREMLDEKIDGYARNWKLERISRIALSVLRLAFFEILFEEKTDGAVIANEAVELAKNYDTKESASFVNGIIGSFLRESAEK